MAASVVTTQTDFSAGEVDVSLKRADQTESVKAMLKAGVRKAPNMRILNSRAMQNRSGRRALYKEIGRVDRVTMAPGVVYDLAFGNGTLHVYDSTGTQVFTSSGFQWTTATVSKIVWAVYDKSIYITYGHQVSITGQVPQVLVWDGISAWSVGNFAELVIGNQKRTLFYRIAAKSITLTPSGTTGTINIVFSANVLVAGMVGTRIRYQGRQITIATVVDGQHGTAIVNEPLTGGQALTLASNPYSVGDIVSQSTTGATGAITISSGAVITVTLGSSTQFAVTVAGIGQITNGTSAASISSVTPTAPPASVVWDQEVMNAYQGWPQSVTVDQNRLIFCNFPSVPAGIAWSATGVLNDFYPDAFASDGLATDAIFELAPEKAQVLFVTAGAESNEFVFCNNALWYIPISPTNPLAPGSVSFQRLSGDGCAAVQPRIVQEALIYVAAGLSRIMAVVATGAYLRPFNTRDISELRTHLFKTPQTLAVPTSDGTFPERYVYVLNSDGTMAIGKLSTVDGQVNIQGVIGWVPWSGNGTVSWVAAQSADVIFTSSYAPNGIGAVSIVEQLDDTRYLDGSQLYNTQPSGLPIPGGKGPLWWLAGGTVDLMDGPLGTRMMGTYTIDANGFLIPQNNAGEDFTSANLVVGQAWSATLEPFIPMVQPGQDASQRMWKRKINRFQVAVQMSSGFIIQRLYGGDVGPNLPAPGTVMKVRRFSTWNQDDDPTKPPFLREGSYLDRPIGRSFDPREAVTKDTPGPLRVIEVSTEVTI